MSNIDDLLTSDRTRSDSIFPPVLDRPTRTTQDEIADQAGFLRSAARSLSEDANDLHSRALDVQLEARTDEAAKRSVPELLSELADLGLSWRDIARLVGVSVPAVRKWRNGESTTGPNRRSVARLLAFIDVLRSDHMVQDVASWIEMPLAGSAVTGLDVYVAGRCDLLFSYAENHLTSEQVLDQMDPDWRASLDDRFEVYTADDGEAAIRLRTEPRG